MPAHIELKINVAETEQKEILIALLTHAGADGFEEEKGMLKVFITEENYNESEYAKIIGQNNLKYSKSIIKERNWNAEWESDFKPVLIGKFCMIRAIFYQPDNSVKHDIIITPKMSFGTGHHATTYLMVEAMERLGFTGKTVFDFGTGTGILAVLAEKCGAKSIAAIDNDEWSISNAIENFNANNCHKILLSNDKQLPEKGAYDVILANINRNIILEHLASIKQHLALNGVVLLSGLLAGDEPVIITEAQRNNLKLLKKTEMNGWICLLMVSG